MKSTKLKVEGRSATVFHCDDPGQDEDLILVSGAGKVFIRVRPAGSVLLGVSDDPAPEHWCRDIISLSDLQVQKLAEVFNQIQKTREKND